MTHYASIKNLIYIMSEESGVSYPEHSVLHIMTQNKKQLQVAW